MAKDNRFDLITAAVSFFVTLARTRDVDLIRLASDIQASQRNLLLLAHIIIMQALY